jgi:CRP-like cAMP-binding protein
MCSLLATTEGGMLLEVGVIGVEGFVGVPAVLREGVTAHQVMAQLRTVAFRISADSLLAAMARGGRLQDLMLRFAYALLVQVSQTALCNRFHTIEQRLCRWLLICFDAAGADTVPLTQEFLSYMLGVPRTGVTLAAGNLQRAELISYRRGKITALDRARLERAACECYRVLHVEVTRALTA